MELRHLRYFVMAAEERNISRASARLNISQPAVSRQIRDLEEELGTALFERESHGLRLTDAGETVLMHARDVLQRSKGLVEAVKAFGGRAKKSLKIGYIPTALPGFLAAGLREFNHRHDDVCVQIREMAPRQQETALRKGELDLALLGHACPELKDEFRVDVIRRTPIAAVLPDDHLLALRKSVDLAELAEEEFVSLHEKNFPGRPEMMADIARRAGFAPDVRFKAEGLSELLGMVSSGAGVAVLPADVDQLPHPGVVFLKLRRPRMHLESAAVWRADGETEELKELVASLKAASLG